MIGRRPPGLELRFDTLRRRESVRVSITTYDDIVDFHRSRFEALREGTADFAMPTVTIGGTKRRGQATELDDLQQSQNRQIDPFWQPR